METNFYQDTSNRARTLTRTIKCICLSYFLPGPATVTNSLSDQAAQALFSLFSFFTVTTSIPLYNVYREAHRTQQALSPKGKKSAMLRSLRLVTGQSSDLALLLQPPFAQQRKPHFIAVPLAVTTYTLIYNYWAFCKNQKILNLYYDHVLNTSYFIHVLKSHFKYSRND